MTRPINIAEPCTDAAELALLEEVLKSGWLTQGPKVAEFERRFALRHGVRHAVATTSCTTALHLALLALDIGPGDEVLVPSFTWIATANVVVYCGATPVLVDVERSTFNLDVADVVRHLTERTRAVIAVHLFGLPLDTDALRAVLPAHVAIVEDAACATGAQLRGVHAGALGDVAAFSFHPRKSITTGEGGMVTCNDDRLAERARTLRNHGASVPEEARHHAARPYLLPDFNVLGFNYRMSDLQGAVGLAQLAKLDGFLAERRRWAAFYADALRDLAWLRPPAEPVDGAHAWQAYVLYVDQARAPLTRDEVMARMLAHGIATRPGTHAVHLLGYYRERYRLQPDDLPAARDCAASTLAIPLHNRMAAADYARVVDCLRSIA